MINLGTPACRCHSAFAEPSKIQELATISASLNNACRDGEIEVVKEVLESQRTTGNLNYLLNGVRADVHGNLLQLHEQRAIEQNITHSPFYIAQHNHSTFKNIEDKAVVYDRILSMLQRELNTSKNGTTTS
jgi:hypothetical protein